MGEFQSKKLSDCLTGVKVAQTRPEERALTRHHDFSDPPTYLVKLALIELFGQALPIGGDKRGWEIPLTFGNRVWLIADWKGTACHILGDKEASASADLLFRKLKTAAIIVGNRVKENAGRKRETDCVSLHNGFGHLSYLYGFFRSASEAAMNNSVTLSVATNEPTDLRASVQNRKLLTSECFKWASLVNRCTGRGHSRKKRTKTGRITGKACQDWGFRAKFGWRIAAVRPKADLSDYSTNH